jgi:hypothetical protein
MSPGADRRRDARYLGGQNFGWLDVTKAPGEFFPAGVHQIGVNLVIDKSIHFKDAIPQILTFAQNAFLQELHGRLLVDRSPKAIPEQFRVNSAFKTITSRKQGEDNCSSGPFKQRKIADIVL